MSPPPAPPFVTETIWNTALAGTGTTSEGRSLVIGRQADWTPEHLLLLAAEGCFMSTLLALAAAADIPVLGYVSSGHLDVSDDPLSAPVVSLSPCVVVGSESDARRIVACAQQAEQESIVARLLAGRVRIDFDVRSLAPAGG